MKGQAQLKISGFQTNNIIQTYDLVRSIIKLGKFKTKITAVVIRDMNTNLTANLLKTKTIKLAD